MERAPRRWTDYGLAGLVVALGVAYWHWRLVLPVPLPQPVGRWNGDLYNIYVPIYHYAYRSSRWLPSWNPYQLAGTPFVANYNGGFFYPVSFLNAVVPVHLAIGYGSALHLALAGVLAFACARALFLSPAAAMLAAAGFMFNDYFLLERIHPSYFAGFAWIPGVLLCAGRLATAPSAARGVLLGLVLAAQFLAGQAQIVCYEAYVLTLLAAAHGLLYPPSSPAHVRRLVTGAATAVAVALGVSAVQLVPTAEVVARAVRGFGGLSVAQTMPMTPNLAVLQGQAFASGPIALLAPLAFAGRARLAALAAVVVTFTGLVGLGTPAYPGFFYHLPAVSLFRLPQTIMHLGALGLAILAGLGVDACVARQSDGAWRRGTMLAVAAGLVAVRWASGNPVRFFAAVVAAVTVVATLPQPRVRVGAAWIVVLLVVMERFARPPGGLMMPEHNDAAFFAPPPFVRFVSDHIGPDRILAIKDWKQRFPIMEKLGTLYGLPTAQDYEPLAPSAYHELLAPLDAANTDAPLFWGRLLPTSRNPGWKLLDLLAVRFVVVAPGAAWEAEPSSRWRPVYAGRDARVYENLSVRPRVFLATRHRVVTDAEESLRAVQSRSPADSSVVIVDRDVAWPGSTEEEAVEESVTLDTPSPDTVEVRVRTPRRALLVLADLYWPGWRVSVDGVEREIVRVDYLFRGVAVDPGVHAVRFWYAPWSVPVGRGVTAATAALLIVAFLYRKAAGRRPY